MFENNREFIITVLVVVGLMLLALACAVIQHLLTAADDADHHGLKYRLHKAWRRIAFWAGDVYVIWYFKFIPWFAWNHHEYEVGYEALQSAMTNLRKGDVMLATKKPYLLSNMAIPGCFKHAGIVTMGGHNHCSEDVTIVEAISEGVVCRTPLWARADRMIFLRPKHVREKDCQHAVELARKMVGSKYDASFNFNIEDELKRMDMQDDAYREMDKERGYLPRNRDAEIMELTNAESNIRSEFDIAFSCTEVVATAWWFRHRQLGIYRRHIRGRNIIIADQFVNRDWHVVWTNVRPDEAKQAGLGEEGVQCLKEYWDRL